MKSFKIFIIFIFFILISGCSKQTLTCIKQEDNDTGNSKTKITLIFKDKGITKLDINNTMNINGSYKNYTDAMANSLKAYLKSFDGKSGIKTGVTVSKNKINTYIKFNLNKMKDKDKDSIGFDYGGSKKYIKSYYEKDGFTCN